jgi:hypothetical protein
VLVGAALLTFAFVRVPRERAEVTPEPAIAAG